MANTLNQTPLVQKNDDGSIILFPDTRQKIKISEDDEITLHMTPKLFNILKTYADIEHIESLNGKSIQTIADEAYKAKFLPVNELRKAHTRYEKLCRLEDVKRKCKYFYPSVKFTAKDYNAIVKQFLKEQDCNTAENDSWEEIIDMYVRSNK